MDFSQKSPAQILNQLCNSRRCGANYLLNIGPTPEGRIPALEKEILLTLGKWIKLYGDSIYDTKPVACKCLGEDFLLRKGNKLYYFAYDMLIAGHNDVTLAVGGAGFRQITDFSKERIVAARWLDNDEQLQVVQDIDNNFVAINFTGFDYGWQTVIRVAELIIK